MCGDEIIPRICISAVAEQIAPLHLHPVDFPLSLIISLLLLSAFFYYPLFLLSVFFIVSFLPHPEVLAEARDLSHKNLRSLEINTFESGSPDS